MSRTSSNVHARDLVGRTITGVDFRRWHCPNHGWITNPVITLDDGSRLKFVTQETDAGDYGTMLVLSSGDKSQQTTTRRANVTSD